MTAHHNAWACGQCTLQHTHDPECSLRALETGDTWKKMRTTNSNSLQCLKMLCQTRSMIFSHRKSVFADCRAPLKMIQCQITVRPCLESGLRWEKAPKLALLALLAHHPAVLDRYFNAN